MRGYEDISIPVPIPVRRALRAEKRDRSRSCSRSRSRSPLRSAYAWYDLQFSLCSTCRQYVDVVVQHPVWLMQHVHSVQQELQDHLHVNTHSNAIQTHTSQSTSTSTSSTSPYTHPHRCTLAYICEQSHSFAAHASVPLYFTSSTLAHTS